MTNAESIDSVNIISPNSLKFYGGGEITALTISSELNKIGIPNVLYGSNESPNVTRVEHIDTQTLNVDYRDSEMESENGVKHFFFHKFPSLKLLQSARLNLILIWRIPSKRQIETCKLSGSSTVLMLHGIGLEKLRLTNPIIFFYQLYMRLLLTLRIKALIYSKIYFQVLSSYQRNFIANLGVPQEKIFLIKNGIEVNSYKVGRNDDCFQVLFIGRIESIQKGINRLLKVSELLRTAESAIKISAIGSGKDADKLRRSTSITYLGFVSSETKLVELEKSNLLICTSNMEVFPIVLLEALCSGLPVISTPVAGPSEILEMFPLSGKLSTFKPRGMVADILNYYHLWKNDKSGYYEGKMKRSQWAKQKFDTVAMAEHYRNMIKEISKMVR